MKAKKKRSSYRRLNLSKLKAGEHVVVQWVDATDSNNWVNGGSSFWNNEVENSNPSAICYTLGFFIKVAPDRNGIVTLYTCGSRSGYAYDSAPEMGGVHTYPIDWVVNVYPVSVNWKKPYGKYKQTR